MIGISPLACPENFKIVPPFSADSHLILRMDNPGLLMLLISQLSSVAAFHPADHRGRRKRPRSGVVPSIDSSS